MIAKGGFRWVGLGFLPSIFLIAIEPFYSAVLLGLPIGIALFFRDPERTPDGDGLVAPADGKISQIKTSDESILISTYMGIYNVHVNRAPVSGVIKDKEYRKGGHKPAFSKDSDRNERLSTDIETGGETIKVTQIAGVLARRITSYTNQGDSVQRGERIGVIAFGSRVDLELPRGYGEEDVLVDVGDRVKAGETVLARYLR